MITFSFVCVNFPNLVFPPSAPSLTPTLPFSIPFCRWFPFDFPPPWFEFYEHSLPILVPFLREHKRESNSEKEPRITL